MKMPIGTKVIAATIGLALLSGCATNSELKLVRDEARAAQRTADQALSLAQEAQRTAQDANERSLRTEEMVNRSFKKSMRK